MDNFSRRFNPNELYLGIVSLDSDLTAEEKSRIDRIRVARNFYEGYHWEGDKTSDKPEVTHNFCSRFVNKFVAFEMGKGFNIKTHKLMEKIEVTEDGMTMFEYLTQVWTDNNQMVFCTELGQEKSVAGEAWVRCAFEDVGSFEDPFNEYPKGRIRLTIIPTIYVFPLYDPVDKDKMLSLTIKFPIEIITQTPYLHREKREKVLYKEIWTKDTYETWSGKEKDEEHSGENKYGLIPFVQIKNLALTGKTEGRGDLEDLIPLNIEYNMKKSDVSEIIDYHASPVTLVFGAKIGSLEKGANKLWGGLPKDAKVNNLELQGDLGATQNYIAGIKNDMCEIGSIPVQALGGSQAVSNTSGVALHYLNSPLIDQVDMKRMLTENGLERLNKMIILISLLEGLIIRGDTTTISNSQFYWNEVTLPDNLPKDRLIEIQMILQELGAGLEDRQGAMERLGKEDVEEYIKRIDADREKHPDLYAPKGQVNSGMNNGGSAEEESRVAMTGQNKKMG